MAYDIEKYSYDVVDGSLSVSDRVSVAGLILEDLQNGFGISKVALQNIERALNSSSTSLSSSYVGLNNAIMEIFHFYSQHGNNLNKSIIEYSENVLQEFQKSSKTDIDTISGILKEQSSKYGIKLKPETALKLGAFINDGGLRVNTRENFGETLLHQLELEVIPKIQVLSEVEKCYSKDVLVKLNTICADILKSIAEDNPLPNSSVALLRKSLEDKRSAKAATEILLTLVARHIQKLPIALVAELNKLRKNKKSSPEIKFNACVAVLQSITEGIVNDSGYNRISDLEIALSEKIGVLKTELMSKILEFSKSKTKLDPKGILYFARMLEKHTGKAAYVKDISIILRNELKKHKLLFSKDLVTHLSVLINDGNLAKEARESMGRILEDQFALGFVPTEGILSEIEKCYSNYEFKTLSYICLGIFKNILKTSDLPATTMSVLEKSFRLANRVEDIIVIFNLMAGRGQILPSSVLEVLIETARDSKVNLRLRHASVDIILNYLNNEKVNPDAKVVENLESLLDIIDTEINARSAKISAIFLNLAFKARVGGKIISYFEKSLDEYMQKAYLRYGVCNEFIAMSNADENWNKLDSQALCAHDVEHRVNVEYLDKEEDILSLKIIAKVLGTQSVNHKVILSSQAIDAMSRLINNNKLEVIIRIDFAIALIYQKIDVNLNIGVLERIEECFLNAESSDLSRKCGEVIRSIQKGNILPLRTIRVLEQALQTESKIANAIFILHNAIVNGDFVEKSTIIALSIIIKNKNNELIYRRYALISIIHLINTKAEISHEVFKNLESVLGVREYNFYIATDIEEKAIEEKIVGVIGLGVEQYGYVPASRSLEYFEHLLLDPGYYYLGVVGIKEILKSGGKLSKVSYTRLLEIVSVETTSNTIKANAIYSIAYNLKNNDASLTSAELKILESVIHNDKIKEALLFAFESHVKNKGNLSSIIIEELLSKQYSSQIINLLYDLSRNYKIESSKVFEFLSYSLIPEATSTKNREQSYKILEESQSRLSRESRAIFEQEKLARSILVSKNVSSGELNAISKYFKEEYPATWSLLRGLEYLLGSGPTQEVSIKIYEIIDLLLRNDQTLPDSLAEAVIDRARDDDFYNVQLLIKISQKGAHKLPKIFDTLSNIIESRELSKGALLEVISGLSLLLSGANGISYSLVNKLLALVDEFKLKAQDQDLDSDSDHRDEKSDGSEVLLKVVGFLRLLVTTNFEFPKNLFLTLRNYLYHHGAVYQGTHVYQDLDSNSNGDNENNKNKNKDKKNSADTLHERRAILELYEDLSQRQGLPSEDIEILFRLLTDADAKEKALAILLNVSKFESFDKKDLKILDVHRNIFLFKKESDVLKKVEAISNLSRLLNKTNANEIKDIFKEGLASQDKRLLFESIKACVIFSKAHNIQDMDLGAKDILFIMEGLRYEETRAYASYLLARADIDQFPLGAEYKIFQIVKKEKDKRVFNELTDVLITHKYKRESICDMSVLCYIQNKLFESGELNNFLYIQESNRKSNQSLEDRLVAMNRTLDKWLELTEMDFITLKEVGSGEVETAKFSNLVAEISYKALLAGQIVPEELVLKISYAHAKILSLISDYPYKRDIFLYHLEKLEQSITPESIELRRAEILTVLYTYAKKGFKFGVKVGQVLEGVIEDKKYGVMAAYILAIGIYESKGHMVSLLNKLPKDLLEEEQKSNLTKLEDQKKLAHILDTLLLLQMLPGVKFGSVFHKVDINTLTRHVFSLLLTQGAVDSYEFDKFQSKLRELEKKHYEEFIYERDEVLKSLYEWKLQNGYGLKEVLNALEILIYSEKNYTVPADKSLKEIKSLWFAKKIEKYLSYAILDTEQVKRLENRAKEFDLQVISKIFDNLKELNSVESLESFFDFVQQYKITKEFLLDLLYKPIAINALYKRINTDIAINALDKKFAQFSFFDIAVYSRLREYIKKLVDNRWEINSILGLIAIANEKNYRTFIEGLEIIADYNVPEYIKNNKNKNVLEIFQSKPEDWFTALHALAVKYNFGMDSIEKDLKTLSREITSTNTDNPSVVQLFESGYIEEFFIQTEAFGEKNSILLQSKASDNEFKTEEEVITGYWNTNKVINQWGKGDILKWVGEYKRNSASLKDILPEAFAVIKRAVFLVHGFIPRHSQIISDLLFYHSPKGRLGQISTGEGKSIIVAMLAILKRLEGNFVDIITSSPVLAGKDAEEQEALYEVFGLTSCAITSDNIEERKECYGKDIVYGDITSFIGDYLRHDHLEVKVRGERRFGVVIVDEVDSMLIDQSSHLVMLSGPLPGFEHMELMLCGMWNFLHMVINKNFIEKEGKLLYAPPQAEDGSTSEPIEVEDRNIFTINYLAGFMNHTISQNNTDVPQHLKVFGQGQSKNWARSALQASTMVENVHYVIIRDQNGVRRIAPADYRNTGVIQNTMHWSDGLHQFLEIKHNLKIKPESLLTSFMSNIAYFKKYRNQVYGMTGTLGGNPEQNLLTGLYNLDFMSIPTYRTKKFITIPRVDTNQEGWLEKITNIIFKEAKKGRATLVISESIKDCLDMQRQLIEKGYARSKIKMYTRTDIASQQKSIMKERIDVGNVIIATNLAGRGTDIKTTKALELNGGMHVIVTYLPVNARVQLQAYGRTSRQGNSGSAQTVINYKGEVMKLQHHYPWYNGTDITELRDLAENERLILDKYKNIPTITLKDELFSKYSKLTKELRNKDNEHVMAQIAETWGLWLKEEEKNFKYNMNYTNKIGAKEIKYLKERSYNISRDVSFNFEVFLNNTRAMFRNDSIMQNPSYLVKRGLARGALSDLDRAIAIDPQYAYAAHYAKARLYIQNDSGEYDEQQDKQNPYTSLHHAKHLITNIMIALLEAFEVSVGLQNITNNEGELSKQTRLKIRLYNRTCEYIDKAMNVIKNSKGEEHIAISRIIPLEDLLKNDDEYKSEDSSEVDELKLFGLPDVFELTAYTPEPDWWDTLFTGILGVLQIVIGAVFLMAPGLGWMGLSFFTGMVIKGAMEVFNAVRAYHKGIPIDLKQYFKGAAISYAINLITMGIQWGANKILEKFPGVASMPIIGKVLKHAAGPAVTTPGATAGATGAAGASATAATAQKAAEITTKQITDELIKKGATQALVLGTEALSAKILEDHKDDIEHRVKNEIQEMMSECKDDLNKIMAMDAWNGNRNLQDEVLRAGTNILVSYKERYRGPAETIARGVTSNLFPIAGLVITARDVIKSLEKISDITDEFCTSFKVEINRIANNLDASGKVLHNKLREKLPAKNVTAIIDILSSSSVINSQYILDCNACETIKSLKIGQFTSNKTFVQASCIELCSVMRVDYKNKEEYVMNDFASIITGRLINLIQHGIINPISEVGISYGVNKIHQNIENARAAIFKKEQERRAQNHLHQERENQRRSTQNTAANPISSKSGAQSSGSKPNTPTNNKGRVIDLNLLSSGLKRDVNVRKDSKLDYVINTPKSQDSSKRPIEVNYNSITKKWTAYNSGGAHATKFDSMFDAVVSQAPYIYNNIDSNHNFLSGFQLAELVETNSNSDAYEAYKKEVLERFHSIVPTEHFDGIEINVLKDAIYKTSKDLILKHLTNSEMGHINLEFMSDPKGDDSIGFFGALFSKTLKDGTKVYIEVYKGTDPFSIMPKIVYEHSKDIVGDDLKMLMGELPDQSQSANAFHERVKAHIGNNKNLYIMGHSLGGSLAQIIGAKYTSDFKGIIDFDGPGVREIITRYIPEVNLEKLKEKLVLFKALPNRINSLGTHIVDPIVVIHSGNKIPLDCISNKDPYDNRIVLEYTISTHDSEAFTKAFDKNGPTNIGRIDKWPVNNKLFLSDSEGAFFYNFDNNPDAWKEHWSRLWKENPVIVTSISRRGADGDIVIKPGKTLQDLYPSFEAFSETQKEYIAKKYNEYKSID